jgi:ABC-type lipoprotein export system ATPase subunit
VLKLLLDLTRRQNKTLIMATHSPEVVPFADRVFRVHDGQLLTTAQAGAGDWRLEIGPISNLQSPISYN